MTDFQRLVIRSIARQTSIEALQQALECDLQRQPRQADEYGQLLVKLGKKGFLSLEAVEALQPLISQYSKQNNKSSSNQTSEGVPAQTYQPQLPGLITKATVRTLDFDTLRQGLLADLTAVPENRQAYVTALERLAERSRISDDTRDKLQKTIKEHFEPPFKVDELLDADIQATELGDLPDASKHTDQEKAPQSISESEGQTVEVIPQEQSSDLVALLPDALPPVQDPVIEKQKSTIKIPDLLTRVKPVQFKLSKWLIGSAAVGVSVLALLLNKGLQLNTQNQIDDFILLLTSNKHAQIEGRIAEILDGDAGHQKTFFGITGGDIELRGYLTRRLATLTDHDEFTAAERLAAWYQDIFQDEKGLIEVEQAKSQAIAEIDEQFRLLFATPQTLAVNYQQINPLWQRLIKIQADHTLLSDRLVALKLTQLVDSFLFEKQYRTAEQVASFAIELLSNNPAFSSDVRVLEQKRTSFKDRSDLTEDKIEVLRNKLEQSNGITLVDYEPFLDDIAQLRQAEPEHKALSYVVIGLENALAAKLYHFQNKAQWQQAKDAIETYGKPLGKAKQLTWQDKVLKNQLAYDKQTERLFRQLVVKSRSGDPAEAMGTLGLLQQRNVSPQTLSEAKQAITTQWLNIAQHAVTEGQWQKAQHAIEQGLALKSDGGVDEQLLALKSETTANSSSAVSEIMIDHDDFDETALVDGLVTDITRGVEASPMTIERIAHVLQLFAELKIWQPDHQLITSATVTLGEAIERQANILEANDSLEALSYAYQASRLLPQHRAISDLVARLEVHAAQKVQAQMNQHRVEMDGQIEQWLSADDPLAGVNRLRRLLLDYEVYSPDGAEKKRRDIANHLIVQAKRDIIYSRTSQAGALLEQAEYFFPKLAELEKIKYEVAQAERLSSQDSKANLRQIEAISLTASFKIQLAAGNIDLAEQRLKQLNRFGLSHSAMEPHTNQLITAVDKNFAWAIKAQDSIAGQMWLAKRARLSQVPEELRQQLSQLERTIERQMEQSKNANSRGYSNISDKPCDGKSQNCYDLIDETNQGPKMIVLPESALPVFAITRYEVTVADYNLYCQATGVCEVIKNQLPVMPVTGLPLSQMQAYSDWLSAMTGAQYRLPTYRQWLLAADSASSTQSNINCKAYTDGQRVRGFTLLAANYDSTSATNDLGLTHYLGNAAEVVQGEQHWWAVGGGWHQMIENCTADAKQRYDGRGNIYTGFRLVRAIGGRG